MRKPQIEFFQRQKKQNETLNIVSRRRNIVKNETRLFRRVSDIARRKQHDPGFPLLVHHESTAFGLDTGPGTVNRKSKS